MSVFRATVAGLLQQPAGRIAVAVALSLAIHLLLLFGTDLIHLAPIETPLPPLVAKLEPLPALKAAPPPVSSRPKPKPKPKPATVPATQADTTQPDIAAASDVAAASEVSAASEAVATATDAAQPAVTEAAHEQSKPAHPLPKQAQLTFIVYKGTGFPVGEARHRLEIKDDGGYTLQVGINTTGIASLFKTFEMNQQSIGTANASGLHPDEFSENRKTSKGTQQLTARFDWQNRQLSFSGGNSTALPEQAQDMLSFLYQLSQLPLDQATLPIYISNGKKLEKYELAVGAEEDLMTRKGKMRALPLHKIHAPGEEGLDIWLGLEYRLLPVKIRQTDRSGEIAGEMVISDIRVSQE